MKKFFAVFSAAVLAASLAAAAVSCGDKESEVSGVRVDGGGPADGQNTAAEDMPYGAHITDLTSGTDENIEVMISFDNRYYGNSGADYTEVYLIEDYICALNKNDIAAVAACYYPGYLEAICKDGIYSTPEEFIGNYRSLLQTQLAEDFSIDYIDVSDCQLAGDAEADSMFAIRDSSLADVFGDEILDKITSRKMVTICGDSYFTSSAGWGELATFIPDGMQFCIYEIDGAPYIF